MQSELIRIGEAADLLGVSIDTLRRWDKSGKLLPIRVDSQGHRFYRFSDIDSELNSMLDQRGLAKKWASSLNGFDLNTQLFCRTRDVFQARLERLQFSLNKTFFSSEIVSLFLAAAGEIGNNSFDHNLGNWPDIMGTFFHYDEKNKTIILADRGQGVLATLKRVRPELSSAEQALTIAFTKIISGRKPEVRGNGLKFVKSVITSNPFVLEFQTGDAYLYLKQGDDKLDIKRADSRIRGCFATIKFKGIK